MADGAGHGEVVAAAALLLHDARVREPRPRLCCCTGPVSAHTTAFSRSPSRLGLLSACREAAGAALVASLQELSAAGRPCAGQRGTRRAVAAARESRGRPRVRAVRVYARTRACVLHALARVTANARAHALRRTRREGRHTSARAAAAVSDCLGHLLAAASRPAGSRASHSVNRAGADLTSGPVPT